MKIEIWSDIVCPFCYIGYQRLQEALASTAPDASVEIIWKSFQLDPTFPMDNEGMPTYTYLENYKGMSQEQVLQTTEQLSGVGAAAGIVLDFKKAIVVNTKKAHRLLHLAKKHDCATPVKTALLKAHFTEGLNIAKDEVLITIAASAGLTKADVLATINAEDFDYEITQDIQEGVNLGLKGVPFFVFDRAYGIPGAQPLDVFEKTIQQCLDRTKELNIVASEGASCDPETGECNA